MDLLGIVQALHREAKQPGSAPTTVAGQSGRAADLIAWAIEAWNDIQRERNGRWRWLRSGFYVDTVADDKDYAYTECTDVAAAAAITRFRDWDMDKDERPLIYLSSDGQSTERELSIIDWPTYRYRYVRASHTAAYPGDVAVHPDRTLYIGPKPDGVYRVSGNYWKSMQELAEDDDVPECPADFHMLVVWRAIEKYGYNIVAQEILARAAREGGPLYTSLCEDQAWSRFSFSLGGPLA